MQRDLARQKGPEDLVLVKRALSSGLPRPAEKPDPSGPGPGRASGRESEGPRRPGAAGPDRGATADAELGRGVV